MRSNKKVIALIDKWLNYSSSEDVAVWPRIEKRLKEDNNMTDELDYLDRTMPNEQARLKAQLKCGHVVSLRGFIRDCFKLLKEEKCPSCKAKVAAYEKAEESKKDLGEA